MTKIYIVMRQDMDTVSPIAAFETEAEAYSSAESHKTSTQNTWVEEINYYRKEG